MGVERVYIYVDQNISKEEEGELPSALRVKNIRRRIVDMYTRRFSSKDCKEFFKETRNSRKPYGCNDQPVTLIEDSGAYKELSKYSFDLNTKTPGTLNVILRMRVIKNTKYHNPPLDPSLVVYSIVQYRAEQKIPIWYGVRPVAYPLDQQNERLKGFLDGFIKGHIH
ncbi:MAG: hypothetical protein COA45_00085 [Zetaproteobacteria bacterium]|nr:MAG: hypothetical protein COA45_00085 [Zetaproteobacteria bacterium]